ncbi:MAG: antitoxin, RHH family protein [Desulfobacterales bacterium]
MPSKNPRINVVLDPPLFKNVQFLAEKDGVSLSTKVRDLLKDAMEIQEDIYLANIAERRENTLDVNEILTHEDTWSK